jgi:hypothetical protein
MQMKGRDINKAMFTPNSKLHAYKVVAKLLNRHKDLSQGQNTMFIPRLTILNSVRGVGRIANCGESVQTLQSVKLIDQPCSRSRVAWTLT